MRCLGERLWRRFTGPYFNELVAVTGPRSAAEINGRLLGHRIVGGLPLERFYPELGNSVLLCCTEMSRRPDMDAVAEAFGA